MQRILDRLVDEGAAGVLLHYRDEQGEWRGSSGVADLESRCPIDPDGWFRIGSVTKTFTAAVVLSLVADGLVEL
ncbi:beta-lactamase family protein [Streptomyces sp. SID13031]|nr:beta-lactamase family protein [Streptomyces sp. SID13031]